MADPALIRLLEQEPRAVPLGNVHTDPRLQARSTRVIPTRHRAAKDRESNDHVARLRLTLEASGKVELDPILLADIDGKLHVVDGHHRTRAYKAAKRSTIPARVAVMTWSDAVIASKLANCENRSTLAPHPEERREWAWQHLARVTQGGNTGTHRVSVRKVAAMFGIDKDTVARMLERLPTVDRSHYGPAACDEGTGFPLWRYVRSHGAPWKPDAPASDHDRAAKRVEQFVKLTAEDTPAVQRATLRLLTKRLREVDRVDAEAEAPEPTGEAFEF